MTRGTVYQSLQSNDLTHEDGSPSLLPVFSSHPSYPARTQTYMDKQGIQQVDISGIQWMMATMVLRKQLDNAAMPEDDTVKVVTIDDHGNKISVRKTKIGNHPVRQGAPVIGLLPRDVLEIIFHFALGVSECSTGFYKNAKGESVFVSRQHHLMERAFFACKPQQILSALILNDLLVAVKMDDRKQVAYILSKNPLYLSLENSDGDTALAMALRTDNTVLVKMMETYFFDETKVPSGRAMMLHQFNTVFPKGYDAHCTQQTADAKKLFMEAGFINTQGECILFNVPQDSIYDIIDTPNNTPKPGSVLQLRFNKFKLLLEKYYNTHSYHNDEILALADAIRIKNFHLSDGKKFRVFSYQAIGAIQKKDRDMFLFRFKNHAQGIVNLAREAPADSFCLRGTSTDARSLPLGVNCCIDVFGCEASDRCGMEQWPFVAPDQELISTKNRILSDIILRCQPQAHKPTIRCCVM